MKTPRPFLAVGFVLLACLPLAASEQPYKEIPLRWPALTNRGFPYPLSLEAGRTTEVEFRGSDLNRVEALRCECGDVTARLTSVEPLALKAEIEAAPDAEPGPRFFYAEGPRGTSNRVMLRVTRWQSVLEHEPNDGIGAAQPVGTPALIEGRIETVHDSDMFRFQAEAGERLVFNGLPGRSGVYGHVVFILLDSEGQELARNLSYFGTDPYIDYTFEKAGNYVLTVIPRRFSDFYTVVGDDQKIRWQYQLAVGRAPMLWSLFPMGGRRGTAVEAELYADFLDPAAQPRFTGEGISAEMAPVADPCNCRFRLKIKIAEDAAPGTRYLTFADDSGTLTPLAFEVSGVPEITESEPNDGLDQGQRVERPVIINGRIGRPGDGDHFLFTVDQFDDMTFRVDAHGIGSHMTDPNLTLARPDGELSDGADDRCSECPAFYNAAGRKEKLDPQFSHYFQEGNPNDAKAAGDYILQLIDNSKSGGPHHTYRILLRDKKPGFRVGVLTDRVTAPLGGEAKIPVSVSSEEGFQGQVKITAENLPEGLRAEPLSLGFGKDSGELIIRHNPALLPAGEKGWLQIPVRVIGSADAGGEEVTKEAELPPFFTEHGAGYNETAQTKLLVSFVEPARFSLDVEEPPFGGFRMEMAKGGEVEAGLKVERAAEFDAPLEIAAVELPKGVRIAEVLPEENGVLRVRLKGDPEQVETGCHAVVLRASAEWDGKRYEEVTRGFTVSVK